MKKKLIVGAVALSAAAVFGLTGCGDKDNSNVDETVAPVTKYTVTFDHDGVEGNDIVREFEEGATVLSDIPVAPEVNGFAGVWDNFELQDENIRVTARYGNGTEAHPYLVSTAEQFIRVLTEYGSKEVLSKKYYKPSEQTDGQMIVQMVETDNEEEAVVMKIERKSATLVYKKVENDWKLDGVEHVYFQIINDIDLSDIQGTNNGGAWFAGCIKSDRINGEAGQPSTCTISGVTGHLFENNWGAMFGGLHGAVVENLIIQYAEPNYVDGNVASIFGDVWEGDNVLKNISIAEGVIYLAAGDNNEGPFVQSVQAGSLKMENCYNNADMVSVTDYFGVFVGGFARSASTVEFVGCRNNGNIISSGKVGVFFGNDFVRAGSITISNCEQNGTIKSNGAHVMCAPINGRFADMVKYDENVEGEVSIGTDNLFSAMTTKHVATLNGNDVMVTPAEEGEMLTPGKYEFIISGYASSEKHGTLLTHFSKTYELPGTTTDELLMNDVIKGIMDYNTYKASDLSDKVEDPMFVDLPSYSAVKYFVDDENGIYVVDYSGYEQGWGTDTCKINKSVNNLRMVLIVRDYEDNIVDFIVNIVK